MLGVKKTSVFFPDLFLVENKKWRIKGEVVKAVGHRRWE